VWNGVKTFRENDETIQSWPGDVPEGLGRKSSAVFPDHTENLEPGSESKPLELVVYVDDWQKYPASTSFGTICRCAGNLPESMTPSHSGCEHNCRSWPEEQTPFPQFRQYSAATNFSAPGTQSFPPGGVKSVGASTYDGMHAKG
jgi:hypothetical protein